MRPSPLSLLAAIAILLAFCSVEVHAHSRHRVRSCLRRTRNPFTFYRCLFRGRTRPICPPQPMTGCFQSSDVHFTPSILHAADWTWTDDGENYGRTLIYPDDSNRNYAFCIYDGTTVEQEETQAPVDVGDSDLLLSRLSFYGSDIDVDEMAGTIEFTSLLNQYWTKILLTQEQRDNAITQLISVEEGELFCWSKTFSLEFPADNVVLGPGEYNTSITLNGDVASPLLGNAVDGLDELNYAAAFYNAYSEGAELDMQEFILANGPASVLERRLADGTSAFADDLKASASAMSSFAWYAATWYLRDVFGGTNPSVNFEPSDLNDLLQPLTFRDNFANAPGFIQSFYLDDTLFKSASVSANPVVAPSDVTGLFGYVLGYQSGVIGLGNSQPTCPPIPDDMLVCPGYDSCSQSPVCPVSGQSSLLPCTYDEDLIDDDALFGATVFSDYATAEPIVMADLLAVQDGTFDNGLSFFTLQQLDVMQFADDSFPGLYSFGNGQLQMFQTAILAAMKADMQATGTTAEAEADLDAIDAYGLAVGFRAAFQFAFNYFDAQGAAAPVTLPKWNFGVTPVE